MQLFSNKNRRRTIRKVSVQYADKEIINAKDVLTKDRGRKTKNSKIDTLLIRKENSQLADHQISRFKGYNEIVSAFDFGANFLERLSQELTDVITRFSNTNDVSKKR